MHGINQWPSVKVHSSEYCQQIVLYQCMKIASWWALPIRREGLASCGCSVFAYHALPSVPASLILGENCTEDTDTVRHLT